MMSHIRFRPSWIVASFVAIFASQFVSPVAAADPVHSFKVRIVSEMNMDVAGQKQVITADTELRYSWQQSRRDRTLQFDRISVKVLSDGRELLNSTMDRHKLIYTEEGKRKEVRFENAPEALKEMLRDSFEAPLVKIRVDDIGRELSRTSLARGGAKSVVDEGMVANALLFHPPFPENEKQWAVKRSISMGNGAFAKGELTYRKTGSEGKLTNVSVAGTLRNKGFKKPGLPLEYTDAVYVITGKQQFDSGHREWVSGQMDIDLTLKFEKDNKPIGTATGKMTLTFERLAQKDR